MKRYTNSKSAKKSTSNRSSNSRGQYKSYRKDEDEAPREKRRSGQVEEGPWAVYNAKLGVVFAKPSPDGPCYAADVDPEDGASLVKAIKSGKEKGLFSKQYLHKTKR
jgi:hypothetical protein